MDLSLVLELRKFSTQIHRLKQVFEETTKCYNEIICSGNNNGKHGINDEMLVGELRTISKIVPKSPSIVVFGQSYNAKARILGELLGKSILQFLDADNGNEACSWMVVFKHDKSFNVHICTQYGRRNIHVMTERKLSLAKLFAELLMSGQEDEHCNDRMSSNVEMSQSSYLEVKLQHPLLLHCSKIVMAPACTDNLSKDFVFSCVDGTPSILLYGLLNGKKSDLDIYVLRKIRQITCFYAAAFILVPPLGLSAIDLDPPDGAPNNCYCDYSKPLSDSCKLAENNHPHSTENRKLMQLKVHPRLMSIYQCLYQLGYFSPPKCDSVLHDECMLVESVFVERYSDFLSSITKFTQDVLQSFLLKVVSVLNDLHTRCLKVVILSAFDMARDLLITPKKLEFVYQKEDQLYRNLLSVVGSRNDVIKKFVPSSILDISMDVQRCSATLVINDYGVDSVRISPQHVQEYTSKLREMIMEKLNHCIAQKLVNSINALRDSFAGTLTRCLEGLQIEPSLPVDAYNVMFALNQMLDAVYHVEIPEQPNTFMRTLFEKMRQIMSLMPWRGHIQVDREWRKELAIKILLSLSEERLAKCIAEKIKSRLNESHKVFTSALDKLAAHHTDRLESVEEQRMKLRKTVAPRLAKLALASTSLRDSILFGVPSLGHEIGRGQYGVVYSCTRWSSFQPVAVKSVVPPDDKHWNDLALEFFYTKSLPEHPRVVTLRGSVIDYMYGNGSSPAVLLIMDRLQRDMHTAISGGLNWKRRLQVAIDVVEGLRYLHSQGLVHRDVKLKNVLLDSDDRAKITDLGFCKPEAMMSGSIVGTPIHMAPELFSGNYANSVDVYAFGILFWYTCAGHVRLPSNFEQCSNKLQLWQEVANGLRPERMPCFSDACWQLMESCWARDPNLRPYFGDVDIVLRTMMDNMSNFCGGGGGDDDDDVSWDHIPIPVCDNTHFSPSIVTFPGS